MIIKLMRVISIFPSVESFVRKVDLEESIFPGKNGKYEISYGAQITQCSELSLCIGY